MNNKKLKGHLDSMHSIESRQQNKKRSLSSISGHKYNLVLNNVPRAHFQQEEQNLPSKQEIEQELLRAFDTQMSFGHKKSLPKGLSQRKKGIIKNNFPAGSASNKNIRIQESRQSQQAAQFRKIHRHNTISQSQQAHQSHTNRSRQSRSSLTSAKPYHHNKRKSLTTEFIEKKQTQNLVQKLLTVKPSQQVSKQKQLQSYYKHVKSKHIMMHRFDDHKNIKANDKKGIIFVKKSKCSSRHATIALKSILLDGNKKNHDQKNEIVHNTNKKKINTIEAKEIQLRRMLQQQKRKSRLELMQRVNSHKSILESKPMCSYTSLNQHRHERLNTIDYGMLSRPMNNAISSKSLLPSKSYMLPKVRAHSKMETHPVRESEHTKIQKRNQRTKSYF